MTDEALPADEEAHRASPDPDEPPRVLLHMPVDVRSLALIVLTVLASIYALHWAKAILVPILLGVMFSYALTPVVDTLQRWHVPRAIGASVVLSTIVLVIGWGGWRLSDDATALIENLPQVAQKLRHAVENQPGKPAASPIEKVQQAANELEQAAHQAASEAAASSAGASTRGRRLPGTTTTTTTTTTTPTAPPTPPGVTRVVVERAAFNVRDYLWSGTLGLFSFLGQVLVVLFVTLFLLASGTTFRRKMVKLAGPRLSQKKITVQALDEVSVQIQRYLLVQLATSRSTRSASTTPRPGVSPPASPTSFPTSARSSSASARRSSASSSSTPSTRRCSSARARSRSTPSSATC